MNLSFVPTPPPPPLNLLPTQLAWNWSWTSQSNNKNKNTHTFLDCSFNRGWPLFIPGGGHGYQREIFHVSATVANYFCVFAPPDPMEVCFYDTYPHKEWHVYIHPEITPPPPVHVICQHKILINNTYWYLANKNMFSSTNLTQPPMRIIYLVHWVYMYGGLLLRVWRLSNQRLSVLSKTPLHSMKPNTLFL